MWRGRKLAENLLDTFGPYLKQTYRGARVAPPNPSSRDRYTVVLRKVRSMEHGCLQDPKLRIFG